jgi:uncharacterized protein YkwD
MVNKKLVSAIVLIGTIAVIFTGCGNSKSGVHTVTVVQTMEVAKQETTAQETTAQKKTTAATTAAPTEAETESQTEAPTEAEKETEAATEAAVEAPTEAAQEIVTQPATQAPTEAATQATQAATAATKATASAAKNYAGEFNKEVAQQVWASVNSERAAAGLAQFAWDETTYEFACQRAVTIVTNYSHDGCGEYGENIQKYSGYGAPTATRIHQNWRNSPAHYTNYMSDIYTKGACAVYYVNGAVYAVENFVAYWND